MAKTIKFNLKLDGNPVRDIKGLQEKFSIDDILEVYDNGLLQKWLKVRGYNDCLKKVNNIDENKSIIIQLIKIFDIAKDESEIIEAIYSLEFEEQRKKELQEFKNLQDKHKKVIESYHKTYEELINAIVEHKENMPFFKTASKEISDKYLKLFELDYKALYEMLKEKAPLMIYAILMNDKLSFLFINDEDIKQDFYEEFVECIYDNNSDIIKIDIYKLENDMQNDELYSYNNLRSFYEDFYQYSYMDARKEDIKKEVLEEYDIIDDIKPYLIKKTLEFNNILFEQFRGATDGYWKDLETKDIKVMILSIPSGTFITTPDNPKKEYSAEEVNGNFLILDGLLYKSNTEYESIIYMKV